MMPQGDRGHGDDMNFSPKAHISSLLGLWGPKLELVGVEAVPIKS